MNARLGMLVALLLCCAMAFAAGDKKSIVKAMQGRQLASDTADV